MLDLFDTCAPLRRTPLPPELSYGMMIYRKVARLCNVRHRRQLAIQTAAASGNVVRFLKKRRVKPQRLAWRCRKRKRRRLPPSHGTRRTKPRRPPPGRRAAAHAKWRHLFCYGAGMLRCALGSATQVAKRRVADVHAGVGIIYMLVRLMRN